MAMVSLSAVWGRSDQSLVDEGLISSTPILSTNHANGCGDSFRARKG
jgi:hypothetical protein